MFATVLRTASFFNEGWYLGALAGISTVGLLFLLLISMVGAEASGVYLFVLLGVAFLAFGFMGIHVEFGRLLGKLGMTPTLVVGIATEIASALLALLLYLLLPLPARWAVTLCLPTTVVLLFDRARKASFPDQSVLYSDVDAEVRIPFRFMTTSVVQGLSLGVPMGFMGVYGYLGFLGPATNSLGCIIASVLAGFVVLVMRTDYNRAIYNVGFVLIALGLLGVGVLGVDNFYVCVLQVVGFVYLDLILWSLGSYLIKECGQRATWLASCPSMALMTGRSLGIVVGGSLAKGSFTGPSVAVAFCVMAFLVMLAALLLQDTENMRTGWGFIRPGGGEPARADGCAAACRVIAGESGLSPRELEILQCLSSGRSRKEIAEEMYVSANTVKTHIYNLYRKLGVHSEKELREYVGQYVKMMSSD